MASRPAPCGPCANNRAEEFSVKTIFFSTPVWLLAVLVSFAQPNPPNTEWRTYGGDLRSTRYMPIDQINASNFNKLEIAWRLKTDFLGPRPEFNFQVTPLVVNGVLYTPAGSRRAVVALDAET